ncbi:MAG: hypothetical protein JKY42_02080 [Flavobacteriales bacterium]|nr:hypothetical protein [Flavobacteriales bacterium]
MKGLFSVILSLVILVTTSGFTLSSHICGGHRVKTVIAMTQADVSCGMEEAISTCDSSEAEMKGICCQNEIIKIQLDEEYEQQVNTAVSVQFLKVLVSSYLYLFNNNTANIDFYKDYSPPLPDKDIPVLFQTFLI